MKREKQLLISIIKSKNINLTSQEKRDEQMLKVGFNNYSFDI